MARFTNEAIDFTVFKRHKYLLQNGNVIRTCKQDIR